MSKFSHYFWRTLFILLTTFLLSDGLSCFFVSLHFLSPPTLDASEDTIQIENKSTIEGERLARKMMSGVDKVKLGVFGRLSSRYRDKYGEEADLLAVAIANELFFENPSNDEAKKYLKSNKTIILDELKKLQSDRELCKMVTQALRVKNIVYIEMGVRDKDLLLLIEHYVKLSDLGIFISGGEAPTPHTFLPKANEFLQSTPR